MYHFAILNDFESLKSKFLEVMIQNNIKGSILLAREGINGTAAGTADAIKNLHNFIKSDQRLANIITKESYADKMPFERAKVRLKHEIVTMGVEDIDPNKIVGTYVNPKDWNNLISDPDVVTIDTRNSYETAIGTFKNAIDPQTDSFRDFPEYVQDNLDELKGKKVAMFCTGGIRCEKSTAYLKQQGVEDVYHLEGGILKYLEEVDENESMWQGECFVFDSRVAVKHKLEQGKYDQCYACRMPITEEDKKHPHYNKAISCHHCYEEKTYEQRQRYIQRKKQIELSKSKNQPHIGGDMASVIEKNKIEKKLKTKK